MSSPELRKKWREHWTEFAEYEVLCDRIDEEWRSCQATSLSGGPVEFPRYPEIPPFPEELRGLT